MNIDGFRIWLIEDERSPNTIRSYISAVRSFGRSFDVITKENMLAYKQQLISTKSPRTAAARITAMNAYCRFAGCPEARVKAVRIFGDLTIDNVITTEELEQLKAGLLQDGNRKGYWTIRFLAETGARVSELVRMRKKVLMTGECTLWTKGKIRTIRISDMLRREAASYFAAVPGDILFPNFKGKEMTARGCAANIERWCRRYGVRPEAAHPHGFRHRFALDFLERSGKDLALLKDLLGHESIETTSIYLKMSEEEVRRVFEEAMGASQYHEKCTRITG